MELVYLWISKYKNIENQGFNLNSKWQVEYNDQTKELKVLERNPQPIANFFGENISNVTAIVGENGAGKSSLMDLLVVFTSLNAQISAVFLKQKEINFIWLTKDENNQNFILFTNITDITHSDNIQQTINRENLNSLQYSIYFSNEINNKIKLHDIILSSLGHDFEIDNMDEDYFDNLVESKNTDISTYKLLKKLSPDKNIDFLPAEELHKQINFLSDKQNKININKPQFLMIRTINITSKVKDILGIQIFDKLRLSLSEEDRNKNDIIVKEFFNYLLDKENGNLIENIFINISLILFKNEFYHNMYRTYLIEVQQDIINSVSIKDFWLKYNQKLSEKAIIPDWDKVFMQKLLSIFDKIEIYLTPYINKEHDFLCCIPLSNIDNNIIKLIDEIGHCIRYPITDIISFEWLSDDNEIIQFSSGEQNYISIGARINDLVSFFNKNNSYPLVWFIDEGDITLHPDWQAKYLDMLINIIDGFYAELSNFLTENKNSIHLIITTHSPFVLSDLPRENVVFLEKDKNGKCQVVKNPMERPQTFASNIHTLFAEGFFMREGTIGHFAKSKIEKVLAYLSKDFDTISPEEMQEIRRIIDLIGEPLIKNKLLRMIEDKTISNSLSVEQRINSLQAQIDELKKNK